MNITIDADFDGMLRRLYEVDEDQLVQDGLNSAAEEARHEVAINFDVGGRPKWPLTKDGRTPLYVTGHLKRACSSEAELVLEDDSFELHPASSIKAVIPIVQNNRYGFFELPKEALENISNAFEKGVLEG
jgi:hypothetical protein